MSIEAEELFFRALADDVQKHRKRAGLTQKELANYAGVGKTVVFDIEHAKHSIQLDTLYKVLKVLNIEMIFKSPLNG